jgi:DNA-directed RNA polymerase III subunit RPC6
MLYDLTPAKEITGGPWYSEYEFDHEFIAELRNFIMMCVRRMNGGLGVGNGVTLKQISAKMVQANVRSNFFSIHCHGILLLFSVYSETCDR